MPSDSDRGFAQEAAYRCQLPRACTLRKQEIFLETVSGAYGQFGRGWAEVRAKSLTRLLRFMFWAGQHSMGCCLLRSSTAGVCDCLKTNHVDWHAPSLDSNIIEKCAKSPKAAYVPKRRRLEAARQVANSRQTLPACVLAVWQGFIAGSVASHPNFKRSKFSIPCKYFRCCRAPEGNLRRPPDSFVPLPIFNILPVYQSIYGIFMGQV
jgi:hypothetical protein